MLRNHFGDVKDQSLGSSVKLESSRSTSSVKSEACVNATRLPELSRNLICINNNASHSSNNSNVEFLNSSQRETSSSSFSPRKNTADLMHKFQADIESKITWKSFDLPRQKALCSISSDSENSLNVQQSAKELEEKLLSNNGDNLDEELNRLTENLSSSTRTSFRDEENRKREIFNFDKSLPLTGDPDIDEEIIAFYKAKRAGGTY